MPKFHYTATDAQGRITAGVVWATSALDAGEQLTGYGLEHHVLTAEEQPASTPLRPGDALEVVGHLADLAQAGVPLEGCLRALAEEYPRGRFGRAMRSVARQLEGGVSLEEAAQRAGQQVPPQIRGLILAGHRSGQLAEVLEELVDLEHNRADLRHRLLAALAYPTLLVVAVLGIYGLFGAVLVPSFRQIYTDFGMNLPYLTKIVLGAFHAGLASQVGLAVGLTLLLFGLCVTGKPAWAQSVLYGIPVVGPLWRWTRLAEWSRLLSAMLDQQIPMPRALRWAADGMDEPDLAAASRQVAAAIEAGVALPESLSRSSQFPPTFRPVVEWGQATGQLGEAFRAAAEMLEGRVRARIDLMEVTVPPLLLIFIVGSVGMMITGLLVPLVSLLHSLSGF